MLWASFSINDFRESVTARSAQSRGLFVRSRAPYRRLRRWRSRCASWPRCCWPRTCNSRNQTAGPRRWWGCGRPCSRPRLQRWEPLRFSAIPPETEVKRVFTSNSLSFLPSLCCCRFRCRLSEFLTEVRLKCFDASNAPSVHREDWAWGCFLRADL